MVDQLVDNLTKKALSRRGFLASAGAVTAATMVGCGNDTTFTPTQVTLPANPAAISDSDILNFALNLEYLEATFYLYAATGAGLSATDSMGGGAVTIKSGAAVPFVTPLYRQIAAELAQTELQHVRALQAAIKLIGGTPVAAPAIDLQNSFNGVATLAGLGSTFDPFASELTFIIGALAFEDVGVTAYTGAAPLFSSAAATNGILSAAAGIQAAEAYHAGSLRTLLSGNAAATGIYTYLNDFNSIVAVRASVGGGNETPVFSGTSSGSATAQSGPTPPVYMGPSSIVAADSTNALGYARTVSQVLHIVYGTGGAAGVSSGGFFPSGMNGLLKTTTA